MRNLLAAAAALALATPTIAADLGGPPAPKRTQVAQAPSMKGGPAPTRPISCYVDAGASLGVMLTDFKVADAAKIPATPNGLFGQLGAGCDYNLPSRFVFGGWGFYNVGEINTKFTADGNTISYDLNKNWAIGGRLGYMVQDTTMLFMRLGYTAASASLSDNLSSTKINRDLSGIVIGAGVETLIAGPIALRFGIDNYRWRDEKIEDVKAVSNMWTGTTSLVFKF